MDAPETTPLNSHNHSDSNSLSPRPLGLEELTDDQGLPPPTLYSEMAQLYRVLCTVFGILILGVVGFAGCAVVFVNFIENCEKSAAATLSQREQREARLHEIERAEREAVPGDDVPVGQISSDRK